MRAFLCMDHGAWTAFVRDRSGVQTSFLQSWEWGDVQSAYGRTIYRFGVQNERGVLIAVALLIVFPLPLGRAYLFSPRGPIIADDVDQQEVYRTITESDLLHDIARTHHLIFWRFEPLRPLPAATPDFSPQRVLDVEPAMTRVIDLSQSEEELLTGFKLRTRYNVRLAAKKGVRVEFVVPNTDARVQEIADQFFTLVDETSRRHRIRSHTKKYYEAMIHALASCGMLEIAVAHHDGRVLAMNMLVTYGDTASYLHSGSTHVKKELKAPYLLQWETMRRLKQRSIRWYDLHGVGPNDPHHRLYGVTQFKEGFGGRCVEFPGTFEFPISTVWYRIYHTVKRFR